MAIQVTMRHPENPIVRYAFIGFSWTVLFFSFFVPFRRGDFIRGIGYFILTWLFLFLSSLIIVSLVLLGISSSSFPLLAQILIPESNFYFIILWSGLYLLLMIPIAYIYNKVHMQWLLQKGYRFADTQELNERAIRYAEVDVERAIL